MSKKIIYMCSKCGKKFNKTIADNVTSEGAGGQCPKCNEIDEQPNNFKVFKETVKIGG